MNLFERIDPFYFLISLAIGLFMTYVFTPTPKIIYKYPTPDNAPSVTYIDGADNCFKYQPKEVKCPTDFKKIKEIPTQSI